VSLTQIVEDRQPQPSLYPLDGIEGAFAMRDADTWLDNIVIENDSEWVHNIAEAAPSSPTSMATDTCTALGSVYERCKFRLTRKSTATGQRTMLI
jgi:hypothetical protein